MKREWLIVHYNCLRESEKNKRGKLSTKEKFLFTCGIFKSVFEMIFSNGNGFKRLRQLFLILFSDILTIFGKERVLSDKIYCFSTD